MFIWPIPDLDPKGSSLSEAVQLERFHAGRACITQRLEPLESLMWLEKTTFHVPS